MWYARLTLALHLRHGGSRDETWLKAKPIADFFADIWNLCDHKYLTLDEIGSNWGRLMEIHWVLLKPFILERRAIEGVPQLYHWLELSPGLLRKWEIKRGIPELDVSQESQRAFLDHTIGLLTERLRQERDLEAGVIPAPPASQHVAVDAD